MATWIDVFSLFMTSLFFFGTIFGILYVVHQVSSRYQSFKSSLEHRGIAVSREGVSVKTEAHFDREHYLDATQRGLVKVLSAATVGSESQQHPFLHQSTSHDVLSRNEHEKHSFDVTMRRSHSAEGH